VAECTIGFPFARLAPELDAAMVCSLGVTTEFVLSEQPISTNTILAINSKTKEKVFMTISFMMVLNMLGDIRRLPRITW
jgi:hypothetical protein